MDFISFSSKSGTLIVPAVLPLSMSFTRVNVFVVYVLTIKVRESSHSSSFFFLFFSFLYFVFLTFFKVPNKSRKATTKKQQMGIMQRKRLPFKAKIHPPKLKSGRKVGVFSARTPHRPNAIGLTRTSCEELLLSFFLFSFFLFSFSLYRGSAHQDISFRHVNF